MEYRASIIVSCWFAVAIISVFYMWIFANKVGDVLFGVFLPVGLLVLVAIIVTFGIASISEPEKKGGAKSSSDLQNLQSKLDVITKEIEQIKKEIEK